MAVNYAAGSAGSFSGIPVTGFPFTMVCWGNFPASTTTRMPMGMGYVSGPTGAFSIEFAPTNTTFRGVSGSGGTTRTFTVNHPAGTTTDVWYHFAYVCTSSTNRKGYINAGLPTVGASASSTLEASFDPGMNRVGLNTRFLGAGYGNSNPGRYAEWAIYSAALNDDEIKALYSGISPTHIRPQNLEMYVPAIRPGDSTAGFVKELMGFVDNIGFTQGTLTPGGISQFDHPRRYN